MKIRELRMIYSENIVTNNYKSRNLGCDLMAEIEDEDNLQEVSEDLMDQCQTIIRWQVKDYIKRMKDKNMLVGGIKGQYTKIIRKGG